MGARIAIAIVLLAAPFALGAGCSAEPAASPSAQAAKGDGEVRLTVTRPERGAVTRASTVQVRGRVSRRAIVRVNGAEASTAGRRFRSRVGLRVGRNRIRVVARRAGLAASRRTIVVTRRRPAPPAPVPAPAPTPDPTPVPTPEPTPVQECHPSYAGACLDPYSADYDCAGGSGDGPDYTGTVSVVGDDPFDLDRDGDGVACDT
jgi:hypothetical protein